MTARGNLRSWSGEVDGGRSHHVLVSIVEKLLGPFVAIATLVASVSWYGLPFSRHYVVLALIVFLLLFPGILRVAESRFRMAVKAFFACLAMFCALLCIGFATDSFALFDLRAMVLWQVTFLPSLLVAHEIARRLLGMLLQGSRRKAVIVGCGDNAAALAKYFTEDRYSGVDFQGFFDDESSLSDVGERQMPKLGDLSEVSAYVKRNLVEQIYIAMPMARQPHILALLDNLRDTTASVFFVPDLFMTDLIQGRVDYCGGMPVVAVCETPFTGMNGVIKRLEDLILGSVILVLISPLLFACAAAVALTSKGPIVFRQRRYGLDGKEVVVYKFRSMTVTEDGQSSYTQVGRGDARVTKVGAFMRKTSLDELPQFINVVQGRMSIVGPRPHAIAVNEKYRGQISGYMIRHKVRPGITGWAQVNGYRGGDDLEHMTKRIEYDLQYLRNWSLLLDLKIILRTVGLVAKDSAAY